MKNAAKRMFSCKNRCRYSRKRATNCRNFAEKRPSCRRARGPGELPPGPGRPVPAGQIINQSTDYDVRCSVSGGGPTGQAGALVHGISKALVMFDENLKSTLKTEKLTTRDSRAVERKKPGRRKARRSFQFSKR